MSWSLQLQHGDFAVSSRALGTVTNFNKLTQDLRCALLQRMGTDPLHSDYGSLIDGGTLPDGTAVPSLITQTPQAVAASLQGELQRVAQYYQNQQLNRAKDDRITYNRVSLTPGEVLLSIADIEMSQIEDTLQVTITLQTATGDTVAVAFPVTAS